MQILSSLSPLALEHEGGTGVAMGFFDGIHIGHRAVINGAVEWAKAHGAAPAVFTFRLPTENKIKGKRLLSTEDKHALIESLGVEYYLCPDFEEIRAMTPEQFVYGIVQDCHARALFCGENFTFGAKAAGTPIVVAINKMDKPTADPDRIRQELTKYELVDEAWGGDTIIVPVSAQTGQGVDQLLEMILLVAEVQDYRANPNRKARGIIIEARLDKGRGPVANVLIKNGTLRVGDTIVAGMAYGRVRAMVNDKGERVKEARPSDPVEVIGFNDVPEAGDILSAVDDDSLSRKVAEERRDKARAALIKAQSKTTLDDLFNQISEGQVKELNIIIKADVQGSVEAVKQSLERLSNDEVKVKVIHGGVGAITETDVNLASASNAIIIGFNVRHDNNVRDLAEHEKVDIRLYRVIYNAIEDIQAAMKGMLAPKFKENVLGRCTVRQTFRVSGVGTVAGCYVTDGKIQRNAQIRLLRDNVVVHEGKIDSLKRFKDDAKEVAAGYECGLGIENYNDVKEGDEIECFVMEEISR